MIEEVLKTCMFA